MDGCAVCSSVDTGLFQGIKVNNNNNNNNNKSFVSSQWTYTYIHIYFKSLRYNRKVHQQLEM